MKTLKSPMRLFASFLLFLSTATCVNADELSIGSTAPKFSLVNAVDGKTVAFHPGDGKVSVVIFTCNQCPYAKAFEPRIIELARQYQAKGVVFYAIDPNDEAQYSVESLAEMKARAMANGYPFPYLKDGDSAIAHAYGARVTPHVYVIDGSGTLRYRGYVDDSAKPEERRTTGLSNALDDLLAGKSVANQTTRAFGCTIKWKA
ncbi:MAG TPA: thioredoxin family protein [Thermoanaerobaculia bacterium]|nr:thioredoxin family protein [Thermoanaerobaculia bacterium]